MAVATAVHIRSCMTGTDVAVVERPRSGPLVPLLRRIEAGRESTPPGARFPRRRIPDLLLVWTEAGSATATVNGCPVAHRPGVLVAAAPGADLDERGDPERGWTAGWLLLDGPWAALLAPVLAARPGAMLHGQPAPRRWLALARSLRDLVVARGEGWDWRAASVLGELLGDLHAAGAGAGAEGPDLPSRVAALVDRNPERSWPVEALARELGLGRSALAHRFTREAGRPPAAFIRRRRCEHARERLAAGASVAQVAERLGFANPFHFSRVYREAMGEPPSRVLREASRFR
jgi:AraC-like DNA-binding protein